MISRDVKNGFTTVYVMPDKNGQFCIMEFLPNSIAVIIQFFTRLKWIKIYTVTLFFYWYTVYLLNLISKGTVSRKKEGV